MIKSLKDIATEDVFSGERPTGLPSEIIPRARRKLFALDAAMRIEDLRTPPGNRLHALKGDRKGQFAICINDQWRICFTFEEGCAYDVQICDYH